MGAVEVVATDIVEVLERSNAQGRCTQNAQTVGDDEVVGTSFVGAELQRGAGVAYRPTGLHLQRLPEHGLYLLRGGFHLGQDNSVPTVVPMGLHPLDI